MEKLRESETGLCLAGSQQCVECSRWFNSENSLKVHLFRNVKCRAFASFRCRPGGLEKGERSKSDMPDQGATVESASAGESRKGEGSNSDMRDLSHRSSNTADNASAREFKKRKGSNSDMPSGRQDLIGKQITKAFPPYGDFRGEITRVFSSTAPEGGSECEHCRIIYEDGDMEDLALDDVLALLDSARMRTRNQRGQAHNGVGAIGPRARAKDSASKGCGSSETGSAGHDLYRTVEDDETPHGIATKMGLCPAELTLLNKARYPSLRAHSKLWKGTVLKITRSSPQAKPQGAARVSEQVPLCLRVLFHSLNRDACTYD